MDIKDSRVLIAGLGLIGGSVAKALRANGFSDINAFDYNLSTVEKAKDEGIINEAFTRLDGHIRKFDFVLCCLSPVFVIPLYKDVAFLIKENGVFAEVGGIKTVMIEELNAAMRPMHELLSLHPMAGSEKTGYNYSSKDIFLESVLVMIKSDRTRKRALMWANLLKDVLGCAELTPLEAQRHDEIIAHVSQVPHVIALALKAMYQGSGNEQFAGGSYKSATRVAQINAKLWAGLMSDNKECLLSSIGEFKKQLSSLEESISSGDRSSLEKVLDSMSGKFEE